MGEVAADAAIVPLVVWIWLGDWCARGWFYNTSCVLDLSGLTDRFSSTLAATQKLLVCTSRQVAVQGCEVLGLFFFAANPCYIWKACHLEGLSLDYG